MNFIISGRGIEITEAIKGQIEKKLGKLNKFFDPTTEAHITLSVQKTRQIVEATIRYKDVIFRAEEASTNLYDSIDTLEDVIERQIRRYRTKLGKRIKDAAFQKETMQAQAIEKEEQEVVEETEFNVIRTKTFPVTPMTVDDAILQMNMLNHEFFVFMNQDNTELNIVYKRKSGDYGLLIPKFD
jgi:putative sigma-54 modulation protein